MADKALRAALRLAIDALKDYRRRNFAIGHNLFIRGIDMISTKRDHESYMRYSAAIETIEKLRKET
jgi:hypothetical protein